jgi:hypothetical protein
LYENIDMNTFYVFSDGESFVKISKSLKLGKTKDIDKASFWASKSSVNSWIRYVSSKYPEMVLKEAKLTIKKT